MKYLDTPGISVVSLVEGWNVISSGKDDFGKFIRAIITIKCVKNAKEIKENYFVCHEKPLYIF